MKPLFSIKAKQTMQNKLVLSLHMKKALEILTLPILELRTKVLQEIDQNPLLEKTEDIETREYEKEPEETVTEIDFSKDSYEISGSFFDYFSKHYDTNSSNKNISTLDNSSKKISLLEHLNFQSTITFTSEEDLKIATYLIGNLNSKGFLGISIDEIAQDLCVLKQQVINVLEIVQSFDPPGIAAKNLQDSLMIQLKAQKKQNSMCYKVLKDFFPELIHNKISFISKKLKIPENIIQKEIKKEFNKLIWFPASIFSQEKIQTLIPDITIELIDNKWTVLINEKEIPRFIINEKYKAYQNNPSLKKEEKTFIKNNVFQGKWLLNSLKTRQEIMRNIALFIIQKQKRYLTGEKNLIPLNYKDTATALNVNISTISRAVANKYIKSPIGITPLKSFFSISCNHQKDISNKTALELLKNLIHEEDKKKPLSDKRLTEQLAGLGISCARRTITKYRKKLKIESATKRKKF
jgi:RNA polymerase sigma-54 factor